MHSGLRKLVIRVFRNPGSKELLNYWIIGFPNPAANQECNNLGSHYIKTSVITDLQNYWTTGFPDAEVREFRNPVTQEYRNSLMQKFKNARILASLNGGKCKNSGSRPFETSGMQESKSRTVQNRATQSEQPMRPQKDVPPSCVARSVCLLCLYVVVCVLCIWLSFLSRLYVCLLYLLFYNSEHRKGQKSVHRYGSTHLCSRPGRVVANLSSSWRSCKSVADNTIPSQITTMVMPRCTRNVVQLLVRPVRISWNVYSSEARNMCCCLLQDSGPTWPSEDVSFWSRVWASPKLPFMSKHARM